MTGKEQIMDKLYGTLAGLFLVYGISTEEGSGKIIIELLKEAEKQLARKISECEALKKKNAILQNRNQQLEGAITKVECYRAALEEIEEYCIHYLKHNPKSPSIDLNVILDIINKANPTKNKRGGK